MIGTNRDEILEYLQDFTEERVTSLSRLLGLQGFVEPEPGWLKSRLFDVLKMCWLLKQWPNSAQLKKEIAAVKDKRKAIDITYDALAKGGFFELVLTEAILSKLVSSDDEELKELALANPLSLADIEAARRVIARMSDITSYQLKLALLKYTIRPVKNDRPEIDAAIEGLTLIWCQAMKITPATIKISASSGSPAMNFIEAGVEIILKPTPQRETIEKRVIAYRKRMKISGADV